MKRTGILCLFLTLIFIKCDRVELIEKEKIDGKQLLSIALSDNDFRSFAQLKFEEKQSIHNKVNSLNNEQKERLRFLRKKYSNYQELVSRGTNDEVIFVNDVLSGHEEPSASLSRFVQKIERYNFDPNDLLSIIKGQLAQKSVSVKFARDCADVV